MKLVTWIRDIVTGDTQELRELREARELSRRERDRATDEHMSRTQQMQAVSLARADAAMKRLDKLGKTSAGNG